MILVPVFKTRDFARYVFLSLGSVLSSVLGRFFRLHNFAPSNNNNGDDDDGDNITTVKPCILQTFTL